MSAGYPGIFPGGLTTGYMNIGAVQKQRNSFGYPGIFPGGLSTSYLTIGAVQKPDPISGTMAATETGADITAMVATFSGGVTPAAPIGGAGPVYISASGRRRLLPEVSEEMELAMLTFPWI